MISAKQSPVPISNNPIDQLRKRLDGWRKSHRPHSRIPCRLWDSAVRLAEQYGLNKTAKALHLNYYDLKKRLNESMVSSEPVPSFIELSPGSSSGSPECVIELESQNAPMATSKCPTCGQVKMPHLAGDSMTIIY